MNKGCWLLGFVDFILSVLRWSLIYIGVILAGGEYILIAGVIMGCRSYTINEYNGFESYRTSDRQMSKLCPSDILRSTIQYQDQTP